jgi:hypothetical protein
MKNFFNFESRIYFSNFSSPNPGQQDSHRVEELPHPLNEACRKRNEDVS